MRLIDAEALKKSFIYPTEHLTFIRGMIDAAPTLEPFRGEWIQGYITESLGEDYDETPYVRCSECNHWEWYCEIDGGKEPPNFCPNCGCDNRGEK